MKKCFKYILTAILGAGFMTACSPEEFEGVFENGIPVASQYRVVVNDDQEINRIELNIIDAATNEPAKGVYPIWEIEKPDGKFDKSTALTYSNIYAKSGDYKVTVKVGNRNGISDGIIETQFHFDKSVVDFTSYFTRISKNGIWHIANKEKGHLACGPSKDDPTGWWSAGEDEKLAFGVYDNVLTFTEDGKYTFDPGESGTIYVNKGVTVWPDYRNPDEDYNVPVSLQNTEFGFDTDGDDVVLTFPKGTNFPYIADDVAWNNPRYMLKDLTPKKMILICNLDGISWQYILTTEDTVEKPFTGFDYNSPDNLWKQANAAFQSLYYAHGGSWEGLPDFEHSEADDVYTVKLPTATDAQWQAQYVLSTEFNSSNIIPGTVYDFSCKIVSNTDLPSFTAKLTSPSDDPSLVNNQAAPAKINAFEDTYIYFTELVAPEIDGNYKFVFDFGGNPDNTEITISNIVVIEHSKNKIVPPSADEPEGPVAGSVIWADVNSAANLMNSGALALASTWVADDGWSPVGNQPTVDINGNNALVTMLDANGGSQWQGQVHFNTGVAIEEGKAYDFAIVLKPSMDLSGATVKPHPDGDDGHFFSEGRHDLAGFEDNKVTYENFVADFSTSNLVITLDFPGCAAGTTIEVKDIIIQEHNEAAGGNSWADVNSAANLMNSGALALASTWVADDGWSPVGTQPTVDINGNNALITMLDANGGSQWQGQVHFNTGVAIEEGKTYDFAIVLNPSMDLYGATVKPHPEGDDGHFFSEGRHDLVGYEDNRVTYEQFTADFSTSNLVITLDFPGCAAGTTIEVKDIIIQEHKAAGGNAGGPNLMDAAALELASTWVANDNWGELANQPTVEINGNDAKITFNEANGGSQWQGQVHFNTGVAIEEGKTYNFVIVLTPSQDIAGATVKPHPEGDDAHFFSEGRHDLLSYEDNKVTYANFKADFSTSNLVITLDFPSCAEGTEIDVTGIAIQEVK